MDGRRGGAGGGAPGGGYAQAYEQALSTGIPQVLTFEEAVRDFQNRAIDFAYWMEYYGGPISFHSYYRGREEQEQLFQQKATKAHYGDSPHNFGLAIDFAFKQYGYSVPAQWWEFTEHLAQAVGLRSGRSFGDANHLEALDWRSWKSQLAFFSS